jgi:hypothetical protein
VFNSYEALISWIDSDEDIKVFASFIRQAITRFAPYIFRSQLSAMGLNADLEQQAASDEQIMAT